MTSRAGYEVIFYQDLRGNCPVKDFLRQYPEKVQAKFYRWIQLLESEGPNLPRPYADVLRGKIRELRVNLGSHQNRFPYFFHGKLVVLTHGFLKKTPQVPEKEIERAIKFMNDFLRRFQGEAS